MFGSDFSPQIFLIVPKLHHNAAAPKFALCKSLSHRKLVGAWRFELQTSCAQANRAISWKSFLFNLFFENKRVNKKNSGGSVYHCVARHAWSTHTFPHSEGEAKAKRLGVRPIEIQTGSSLDG